MRIILRRSDSLMAAQPGLAFSAFGTQGPCSSLSSLRRAAQCQNTCGTCLKCVSRVADGATQTVIVSAEDCKRDNQQNPQTVSWMCCRDPGCTLVTAGCTDANGATLPAVHDPPYYEFPKKKCNEVMTATFTDISSTATSMLVQMHDGARLGGCPPARAGGAAHRPRLGTGRAARAAPPWLPQPRV